MNVGLPGTGLGGLFYLLTALLMPIIELVRTVQGRSSPTRWRVVRSQAGLAAAVFASLWMTSKFVEFVVPAVPVRVAHTIGATSGQQAVQMVGVTPTVFTCAVLAAILIGVEAVRVVLMARQARRQLPASSSPVGVFMD